MAARCGINNIRLGDKQVPAPRVVQALESAKTIKNVDTAIAKSYEAIKETGVSFTAWDKWFRSFQEPKTIKNIKSTEISNNPGQHAENLAKLLNLAEYDPSATYEAGNYAKRVFNRVKSNLLQRGKGLTDDEIYVLTQSLKSVLTKDRVMRDISKLRTNAKRNLKTKLHENAQLRQALEGLLEADPRKIPAEKIEIYTRIIEEFGQRKAILNFREVGQIYSDIQEFHEGLDQSVFEKQAKIEAEGINPEILISQIKAKKVDFNKIKNPHTRAEAKKLSKLTKEDLSLLEEQDLKYIVEGINNINSGVGFPHQLRKAIVKITAAKDAQKGYKVIEKTNKTTIANIVSRTLGYIKFKIKGNINALYEVMRSSPLSSIDEIFGHKGKTIQNMTVGKQASAYSKVEAERKGINIRIDTAENALAKKFKGNKLAQAKFEISYAQLQREFEANQGQKGVHAADEFIDETIAAIKAGKANGYNEETIPLLEALKKKHSGKTAAQVLNSLTAEQKAALEVIDDINQSQVDKVLYLSGTIRGEQAPMYEYYTAHNVISNDEEAEAITAQRRINFQSGKAAATQQRTEGAKAIGWDPFYNASKAAGAVTLDFHMTPVNQEVLATIENMVEASKEGTQIQKDAALALQGVVKEVLSNVFAANSVEVTGADQLVEGAKKIGYFATLASAPRAVAELTSNLAFAMLGAPKQMINGARFSQVALSKDFGVILNNVGSSQTGKMTDAGVTGSKHIDEAWNQKKRNQATGKSEFDQNVEMSVEALKKYSGFNFTKSAVAKVSEVLIATPDKAIARPLWVGAFAERFKKMSGSDPDFNKIREGDAAYLEKHAAALKESRLVADDMSILAGATNNPFSSIVKLQQKKDKKGYSNTYRALSGYLQRFLLFEYSTAKTAVMSMVGNGYLTRTQGAGMLAGAVARMSLYGTVMHMMSGLMAEALGYGVRDDDEEEDFLEMLQKDAMGSMLTLFFGRNLTNFPKIPINAAIEHVNSKIIGEEIYDEDPFKHSLVWSQLGDQDFRLGSSFSDWLGKLTGPYSPFIKGGNKVWKDASKIKAAKGAKKEALEDEFQKQALLQFLGHTGLLPLFKDVNKLYQQEKYNRNKKKRKSKKGDFSNIDLNLDLDVNVDLDIDF